MIRVVYVVPDLPKTVEENELAPLPKVSGVVGLTGS